MRDVPETRLARITDVFTVINAKKIDAKRGRERGENRVGAVEGGSGQSNDENDGGETAQMLFQGKHRKQAVGQLRNLQPLLDGERVEQRAQRKEEQVNGDGHEAEAVDVFLSITQGATAQILLHHVLVETRHDHRDEGSGEKLLPEIAGLLPVPEKDSGIGTLLNGMDKIAQAQIELVHDRGDREHNAQEKKRGLEGVGPNQRLDPALVGIGEDQRDDGRDGDPKGNAPPVEHKHLDDTGREIQPGCCAQCAGDQKESRATLLSRWTKTFPEITVNGGEIKAVVERQQNSRNHHVTDHVSKHDLEIRKLILANRTRDGDEGYSRERIANHSEGHCVPRRSLVPEKIGIVGGIAARVPGDHE